MADIRLWRNRVAAPAYRLRSSWQRRINRFKRNKTRELTLREDTFKKAEIRWQEESIARSRLEQRLLFLVLSVFLRVLCFGHPNARKSLVEIDRL